VLLFLIFLIEYLDKEASLKMCCKSYNHLLLGIQASQDGKIKFAPKIECTIWKFNSQLASVAVAKEENKY
jgi:hypothetical protein